MGFIRSSLVFIISSILFMCLLLTSIFLTLSWSTNYETIKSEFSNYAHSFIIESGFFNLEEEFQDMEEHCITNNNYIINDERLVLEIPCEIVAQGQDKIIEFGVDKILYDYYYKNYSCEFLGCLQRDKNFFVLVSLKANEFWRHYFYILLIISVVLVGLLFLSVKKKSNLFITTGFLLIFSSLILKAVSSLINWVPEKIVSDIVGLFFSRANYVFLIFLILGILLLIFGFAIKIIKKSSKISQEFSKIPTRKNKNENQFIGEKIKKNIKKEIKKQKKNSKSF